MEEPEKKKSNRQKSHFFVTPRESGRRNLFKVSLNDFSDPQRLAAGLLRDVNDIIDSHGKRKSKNRKKESEESKDIRDRAIKWVLGIDQDGVVFTFELCCLILDYDPGWMISKILDGVDIWGYIN